MTRKRRKKTLKLAKGYWGSKSKHFKMAKEQVMKSGNYAFVGRKQKKRDFRSLWITRINAACRAEGVPALDLHGRSGITPENAVRFKRVRTADGVRDLPYPDYAGLPFDPEKDPYPYPPEARALTYDGLHPTDEGNEILAALLAEALHPLL